MCDEMFIESAPMFEGEFDFSCFAASDDRDAEERSQVRRIFSSRARRSGERLIYRVTGSGYLKHMVRNIAGTLLQVGRECGQRQTRLAIVGPAGVRAGPTAPACGLAPWFEVQYPAQD